MDLKNLQCSLPSISAWQLVSTIASFQDDTVNFQIFFHPVLCLVAMHNSRFFFLRLPIDQDGPVSKMSNSRTTIYNDTGPFTWGEAHCAGEKVQRKREDHILKSHHQQNTNNKNKAGRSPPRQPGTPWPSSQLHGSTATNQNNQVTSRRDSTWYV